MAKIDICYIVSHGFAARMVFQTGLLQQLAQKGLKVAVITPDENDSMLVENCKQFGIQLFQFKENQKMLSDDFAFRRKYFLEDIRANPALWEKHRLSVKGNTSKHPWRQIRPYIYFAIHELRQWFPSIKSRYIRYEKKKLDSEKARKLIREIDPKIIVSTYPVNMSEAKILHNANHLGIHSVIHLLSWDNISAKGYFPALAKEYIAWGPIMKREFQSYYDIKEEDVHQTGVPHFDLHVQIKQENQHKEWIRKSGLNPDQPYLFVGMSSPRFAPKEIDIVEQLAKKINENHFGPNLQMLVRPHPQNITGNMADKTWLPRLNALASERVKLDMPSLVKSNLSYSMENHDMIRLSSLIYGSSVVLNSGSTISIDALMLDRPVIITSFDADADLPYWKSARRLVDYTHLKKFTDIGGVDISRNSNQLYEMIQHHLNDSKHNWELRTQTRFEECGDDDGKATERVARVLESMAKRNGAKKNEN